MLYESNRVRNFQFKYGLLILSVGFLAVTIYPWFIPDTLEVNAGFVLSSALTFCVSVLCIVAFARLRPSWKTVALNRMRIVVGLGNEHRLRYGNFGNNEWSSFLKVIPADSTLTVFSFQESQHVWGSNQIRQKLIFNKADLNEMEAGNK